MRRFLPTLLAGTALAGGAVLYLATPSVCHAGQLAKLVPQDTAPDDRFGTSVAIKDDVAVVGARWNDEFGENAGAAYVFQRIDNKWIEQTKLTASDPWEFTRFGQSVAISGDTILVGAPRTDDVGTDSGAAYVFRFVANEWIEEDKLTAPDAAVGNRFGISVSVSGHVSVVGSHREDNACPTDPDCNSGSAYVFRRDGATWTYEAKLTASDATAGAEFGLAVSVDGGLIVIGSYLDDAACPEDPACDSGAAYVYQFDGVLWNEEAKLTASDGDLGNWFGGAVAVEADTVIVGAARDSDAGTFSGSAYVFERPKGGWVDMTETAKLRATDGQGSDRFGESVSIGAGVVLVGARNEDSRGSNAGAAYVYRHDGLHWAEQRKLTAVGSEAGDRFGIAVANDGDTVLIAATRDDSACPELPECNSGAAYVFDVTFDAFDLRDCARLQWCYTGPGAGESAVSCLFDFDLDADVDLEDWRAFVERLGGP